MNALRRVSSPRLATLAFWMKCFRKQWCARALAVLLLAGPGLPQDSDPPTAFRLAGKETLHYTVEWRLITAGKARLEVAPSGTGWANRIHVESVGLVSKLFKVSTDYLAQSDARFCAESSLLTAHESSRHRETKVTFDREGKKAHYLERDLTKNSVITHEVDIPPCVYEIAGSLMRLRTIALDPGKTAQIPVSDGKKSVLVRVDGQERDVVKTARGKEKTIRYEAFLFNNVLYRRPARVFIWLTDDAKRTPVQIQVKMQIHIGTITLQLEKEE
jgi:uncharacterized protein DUF3108